MLFDDGTGPIRDLAWLDPTGSIRANWETFLAWKREDGEVYRPRAVRGLGPISVTFTHDGPIEHCSVQSFKILKHRVFKGQYAGTPDRVGCSPDLHDYTSPEGTRWAIENAFGFFGMKTPYTDTFPVWEAS